MSEKHHNKDLEKSFEFLINDYGFDIIRIENKQNNAIFSIYYCFKNNNDYFIIKDMPNYFFELYEFYKINSTRNIDEIESKDLFKYLKSFEIDVYSQDEDIWDKKIAYYKDKKKKDSICKRFFSKFNYSITKEDVLEVVVCSIKRQIANKGEFFGIKVYENTNGYIQMHTNGHTNGDGVK